LSFAINNARLLDKEGLVDIVVEGEKIQRVTKSEGKSPSGSIDARGGLVLSSFVEPHVHLDKVLLAEELKEATSISEAREIVKDAKRNFSAENVRSRIERVLPWAIQNGVTYIRSHVDVDPIVGTTSVKAIIEIKKKFRKLVDIQIVAFPQEGLAQSSTAVELVNKSLDLGCEVVGGMPEAELSTEDSRSHIDTIVSIAKERNLALDVHCDVLPFGKNIEYFATQSLKHNFKERSTADHLIALSYYDDYYAAKIIALIKKASMNVITNPCTMMTSGTLDSPPKGRGLTLAKDLMRAGVNVAFGSDNIVDPYNPFGDFNPLSSGWLLAYGAQLSLSNEADSIVRMPTAASSTILGLENYGISPGSFADFNIFREHSAHELLRIRPKPSYVFKRGKKICENLEETRLFI
jgi:cytosine/creatinine deaminase